MSLRLSLLVLALALPLATRAAAPPTPRADALGELLPDGAIARLGSTRFRQTGFVRVMALRPDGKLAAAASDDVDIYLWEIPSGRSHGLLRGHPGVPVALCFSPDGRYLATGCFMEVRLWEITTGKLVWTAKSTLVVKLAFSATGETLAAARNGVGITFWDVKGGKVISELSDNQCSAGAIAFAPDGKTMATARINGAITLWDVQKQSLLAKMNGHIKAPFDLQFSPDGRSMASASEDHTVRLWDVAKRADLVKIDAKSPTNTPHCCFVDGGKSLFFANGSELRRWDVKTGKNYLVWGDRTNLPMTTFATPPDGRITVFGTSSGPHALRVLDLAAGKELEPGSGHFAEISNIEHSPNGTLVATCSGGNDPTVRLWDTATFKPLREFISPTGRVSSIAFSPDSRTLASGSIGVHLWDVESGRLSKTFLNKASVEAVDFSPDGKTVAATTMILDVRGRRSVGQVHSLDVDSDGFARFLFGHPNQVHRVSFGREGRTLFTDLGLVWNLNSASVRHDLRRKGRAARMSPDGRLMASLSTEDFDLPELVVVEVLTNQPLWSQKPARASGFSCLRFSPDGQRLASGDGESICIWDAVEGKALREFKQGHTGSVRSVAFAPDGRTLATGDSWGQVLFWDVRDVRVPESAGEIDLIAEYARLGDEDPKVAYQAIRRLAADPQRSVAFLAKHLKPIGSYDPNVITKLLLDLDAEEFEVRQRALAKLGEYGSAITPRLRQELADKGISLEVRRRIMLLLRTFESKELTFGQRQALRAVGVLESVGSNSAKVVLRSLFAGHPEALLTRHADEALRRLARR